MKNSQVKVKVSESATKTTVLPRSEKKIINTTSEVKQEEKKTADESQIEEQTPTINKRILKKYRNFWKLGNKDFNTHYFDINENGDLIVLEGNYQYNIKNLVEKYGSSLEIFFPFILKERVNDLMDLFKLFMKYYKYRGKFFYHFPMKVNQHKEYLLSLVAEGVNLEVASYNELYLVKKLWEQGSFHSDIRVICNGPKTEEYLQLIEELKNNNLTIIPIIEHKDELDYLMDYKGEVGIRVDLNVHVSSRWDKKINRFGFAPDVLLKIGRIKNLKVLHYHTGSQIQFLEDMMTPVKKAMEIFIKLKKVNPSLDTIDVGGGMPIPYERKKMYGAENVIKNIIRLIQKRADKKDIPHPNIICEWGWYVTAPSQITIFKVIGEKDIPRGNAKKWYIIDGSFINDLPDTWALRQKWHVVPINSLYAKKLIRTWIGGSSCDSDDKYINHGNYVLLPRLKDLPEHESLYIAFLDTGAYQDALGSHHCLLSAPLKIIAQNGETQVMRKRETSEDVGKLFGW